MSGYRTEQWPPQSVSAQIAGTRWDLLYNLTAEQNKNSLVEITIRHCKLIARSKEGNNTLLRYRLDNLRKKRNPTQKLNLLKTLIDKLTPNQYHMLLLLNMQEQSAVTTTHTSQNLKSNLQEDTNLVLQQHLFGAEAASNDFSELSDVISDATSEFGDSVKASTERTPHLTLGTELTTPFTALLGIFQVGYDATLNNAYLRNAYYEYKQSIKSLDVDFIQRAIRRHEDDPDAQIQAIKNEASKRMRWKLFAKTLYSGSIYSIFFAMILGLFFPAAIAFAVIGIAFSAVAALYNRYQLGRKIHKVQNQPELDNICFQLLQETKKLKKDSGPVIRRYKLIDWINFPAINRIATHVIRFASLVTATVMAFLPFATGIIAAINSMFTWRPLQVYLKAVAENPIEALNKGLEIDTETPSFYEYYGSNLMRTYLLKVRTLEMLERELTMIEAKTITESTFMKIVRAVFSPFGLINSSRTHAALSALYDGTNPRAILLLERLRIEAKSYQFRSYLEKYLQKNTKKVQLFKPFNQIYDQYQKGNKDDFEKLMHFYLEDTALNNVRNTVIITGITTGLSWSLLILGVGLTFFTPLAPVFAIAAGTIVVTSIVTSVVAGMSEKARIRNIYEHGRLDDANNLLQAPIDRSALLAAINNKRLPHIELLKDPAANDLKLKFEDLSVKSYSKLLKAYNLTSPSTELDMPQRLQLLSNSLSSPDVKHYLQRDFITQINPDTSISLQAIDDTQGSQIQTVLTAPPSIDQRFNLHAGQEQSWQALIAFMLQNDQHQCAFSLGNVNLEQRATQFIEALLYEFMSYSALRASIEFSFEDFDTAHAIYKVLEKPTITTYDRATMDKVRAHFGLILIGNDLHALTDVDSGFMYPFLEQQYMQNIAAFAMYDEAIARKENKPMVKPYKAPEIIGPLPVYKFSQTQTTSISFSKRVKLTIQNALQSIRSLFVEEELVSLEASKLICDDQTFKTQILACFKRRKDSIERLLQKAIDGHDEVLLMAVEKEIISLESDFAELVQASQEDSTPTNLEARTEGGMRYPGLLLPKAVLAYCEKRRNEAKIPIDPKHAWLEHALKPDSKENRSINKLYSAAEVRSNASRHRGDNV